MATYAVEPGHIDWPGLVSCMSMHPARILGIDRGHLSAGAVANIAIVDPRAAWTVAADAFVSKSRNNAFIGRTLRGVVEYTIVNGRVVYQYNA